jgi:4'-phosphopantetheinyl transferase
MLRKGFISISRCSPFVVFALARKPVGLDLELVRRDDDLIDAVARSFSTAEQSEIGKSSFRAGCFCRIWSRKEALAKRAGTGIVTDLAALDTLHPEVRLRSLPLCGRYWLSLAG